MHRNTYVRTCSSTKEHSLSLIKRPLERQLSIVPFTSSKGMITTILKGLRKECARIQTKRCAKKRFPTHNHRTTRETSCISHGSLNVCLPKNKTVLKKLIHVWRLNIWISHCTKSIRTLIIRKYEQYIGSFGCIWVTWPK